MNCSDDTRSERRQSFFFNINALDDNLLLEILIRLPAKCAHRYKSVSKLWNSLISHPDFVRRFIHHRQSLPLHQHQASEYLSHLPFTFFFCYGNRTGQKLCITSNAQVFKSRGFSLRFLPYAIPENHLPVLIASYNDLLLCRVNFSSPCIVYCICNPLTMQSVVLPPAPRQDQRKLFQVGFVSDAVSGQVTILRVPDQLLNGDGVSTQLLKLEIFSSQANVWREFNVSCPPSFSSNRWVRYCVVCNQILYWLCNLCILSYDVFGTHGNDDDRCRFIDFPSDFKAYLPNKCLGVCQGRLRLSQLLLWHDGYNGGPTLIVWQLMEDYKWCLEHKVVLSEMASETPEIIRIVHTKMILGLVLGFHPQDADIVYLRLLFDRVVLCNIRSRTLKLACNISPPPGGLSYINFYFRLVLPWWPTPVPILPQNAPFLG